MNTRLHCLIRLPFPSCGFNFEDETACSLPDSSFSVQVLHPRALGTKLGSSHELLDELRAKSSRQQPLYKPIRSTNCHEIATTDRHVDVQRAGDGRFQLRIDDDDAEVDHVARLVDGLVGLDEHRVALLDELQLGRVEEAQTARALRRQVVLAWSQFANLKKKQHFVIFCWSHQNFRAAKVIERSNHWVERGGFFYFFLGTT